MVPEANIFRVSGRDGGGSEESEVGIACWKVCFLHQTLLNAQ